MSHFTVMRTRLVDVEALVKALGDVGFKQVEVHQEAQHLHGFMGDRRKQTAEVIIRKKHIGRMSNDIGFKRQADSSFDAIISQYDRSKYSPQWLNRLTQRYAYHTACAKLQEQGFTLVSEETEKDGRIHIVVRRAA